MKLIKIKSHQNRVLRLKIKLILLLNNVLILLIFLLLKQNFLKYFSLLILNKNKTILLKKHNYKNKISNENNNFINKNFRLVMLLKIIIIHLMTRMNHK